MEAKTMMEQIKEAFKNGTYLQRFSEIELDQTYKVYDYGDGETESWTVGEECEQMGFNQWLYNPSNKDEFDQDGFDRNGLDRDRFDRNGFNRDGFNRDGLDRDGYNKIGLDRDGYDINGYDRFNTDRYGNNKFEVEFEDEIIKLI